MTAIDWQLIRNAHRLVRIVYMGGGEFVLKDDNFETYLVCSGRKISLLIDNIGPDTTVINYHLFGDGWEVVGWYNRFDATDADSRLTGDREDDFTKDAALFFLQYPQRRKI